MKILTIYPRGYTSGPADASARQLSSGDLVADTLYDYLGSSRGRPKNWNYHSQILDYALVQFGDFHTWLDTQLSNPHIGGSRREFLIDTLCFINGGQRTMSHHSWSFVLDEAKVQPESLHVARQYQSRKYLEAGLSTPQILQKWCARSGGINDLVSTLHVLFGHVGRTPA